VPQAAQDHREPQGQQVLAPQAQLVLLDHRVPQAAQDQLVQPDQRVLQDRKEHKVQQDRRDRREPQVLEQLVQLVLLEQPAVKAQLVRRESAVLLALGTM